MRQGACTREEHASNVTDTRLSQVQAARAARVSRTTIYHAIKQGRLSAEQDEHGSVRVDASELLRLFPDADLARAHTPAHDDALDAHRRTRAPGDGHDPAALYTLVEELKADKLYLQSELERASAERTLAAQERARFMAIIEQKDRLLAEQAQHMRLLTDQRSKKQSWWRRFW